MITILKMGFNIKILLLIILFVNTVFSYNKEEIASSSDILVVALPTVAFAQTFAFNDRSGTLKLIAGVASAQLVT